MMNRFLKSRADLLITLVAMVVLGTSLVLIRSIGFEESQSIVAIGQVTSQFGDVRAKGQDKFTWRKTLDREGLPDGEALYAGERSSSTFTFNDGSRITLDENSLVVLRSRPHKEIDLGSGNFKIDLAPATTLRIRHGGRVQVLQPSRKGRILQINSTTSGLVIKREDTAPEMPRFESLSPVVNANRSPSPHSNRTSEHLRDQTLTRKIARQKKPIPKSEITPHFRLEDTGVEREPARDMLPKVGTPITKTSTDLIRPSVSPLGLELSGGLGSNYMRFNQEGSQARNVTYASFQSPSASLRASYSPSPTWAAELAYNHQPSKIRSDQIAIESGGFVWSTWVLEFKGRFDEPLKWRLGVQRHELPYLQFTGSNSASVRAHRLLMLTAGFDYMRLLGKEWRASMLIRWQHPLMHSESNGDSLNVSSRFAFDGSLGLSRRLSQSLWLGGFAYGQWLDFRYSMLNAANNRQDSGKSSYFYSNLELRLEYLF